MLSFLNYWEKKYKHVWEVDKEAYIRRYEKAQKALASFEADIARYLALKAEVGTEEAATPMRFLRIDCAPLKQVGEAVCCFCCS
jgi:dynein heavy chain, axonemal